MAASLFDEYLRGSARPLYGAHFADAADRRRAVERAVRPVPPEVLSSLRALHERLPPSPAREEHLAALAAGAAAVVTGQQVGLFLGPLYTVYKAASAVAWARELRRETGQPVVPVFWLQTEDHDLPEVASCHVQRPQGAPLLLSVPGPKENRRSVAHLSLPAEVAQCLGALGEELGSLPHGPEHLALLERHWRPGEAWAQAFAGVLAELFADEGLLFLDPRDPVLAPVLAPVHRRAVEDADRLSRALLGRTGELQAQGFTAPIHVREGAPLSFFHPDGAEGPRYRLAPHGGGLALVGDERERVLSREELLAALAQAPRKFSTSALLRPIAQDVLLPTAAYVGGPAEVAYFGQLSPLYDAFGMRLPLVVPRARFRVIEARAQRTLSRLGLSPDDAQTSEEALLQRLSPPVAVSPEAVERQLSLAFARAVSEAAGALPIEALGLGRAVQKTLHTARFAAARFRRSYERAARHQDLGRVEDVRRLRWMLYPEGAPQERFYGISYFAARYGGRAFVQQVLDSVAPLDPGQKDVRP